MRGAPPRVSLLRRVVGEFQLGGPGAPFRKLKVPTALQSVQLMKNRELPVEESVGAQLEVLAKLMPDATPEEIIDLSLEQMVGLIEAATGPLEAMEKYAQRELADPNGTRGTTTQTPPPETTSGSSASASPPVAGAASGAS